MLDRISFAALLLLASCRQPVAALDTQRGASPASHSPCSRDAECTGGAQCFAPVAPRKGCGRLPAGCRPGDTCTDAGLCARHDCTADTDCPDNYACTNLGLPAVSIECRMKPCTRDDECRGFCVNGWCKPDRGRCLTLTPVY